MSLHTLRTDRLQKGFTLIELLITVTVLGVLMAVALPNLRSFIVSNRLSSNVNGFIGLINYARSEALVRNQAVIVCPKDPAAITCIASQAWNAYELQVFVDVDGSNTRNAGDILLTTVPAMDPDGNETSFVRQTAAGDIEFGAVGMAQTAHRFDIHAVAPSDSAYETKYGRAVCISKPGRVKVLSYSSTTTQCDAF
jgi:type IV fimbrial biogenesis protein FimT